MEQNCSIVTFCSLFVQGEPGDMGDNGIDGDDGEMVTFIMILLFHLIIAYCSYFCCCFAIFTHTGRKRRKGNYILLRLALMLSV